LKLPTTETRAAAGAHTANDTPATPPRSRTVRAQFLVDAVFVALVEKVEVLVPSVGRKQ
jgi:hypothetical protein